MYVAFDIVDLIIAIAVIIIASLVLYYLSSIKNSLDKEKKQEKPEKTNVGYIMDCKDFPKIVAKRKNEKGEFIVVKEMVVDEDKWYNDFEIVEKKEVKK